MSDQFRAAALSGVRPWLRDWFRWPKCQASKSNLYRRDCSRPARWIVQEPYGDWLVCGYHRRAWLPRVCFPIGQAAALERFRPL